MASSFSAQIPLIIHIVSQLTPKTILDIGKGFGKYGFLIHEYVGISKVSKIDKTKSMSEQSKIKIDAVEIDETLMMPHLKNFYHTIYEMDILDGYKALSDYELILMIDVIEHLEKVKAIEVLKYFISKNVNVLIATPSNFFEQHLYESTYENHVSFWNINDFVKIGHVSYQYIEGGVIYLLSSKKLSIRGFGNGLIKKLRRIARALKNEF